MYRFSIVYSTGQTDFTNKCEVAWKGRCWQDHAWSLIHQRSHGSIISVYLLSLYADWAYTYQGGGTNYVM